MPGRDLAAVCGTYCGACRFYGERCTGCGAVRGKPFWVKEYSRNVCRMYDCCVSKSGLEHYGECSGLPCALFIESSDPSLTPEEAEVNRNARIAELKKRNAMGTEAWLTARRKSDAA
jgi:hypothetical protein